MNSAANSVIIQVDPRLNNTLYSLVCVVLMPVLIVGGAFLAAHPAIPNWVASLPLPFYSLLMEYPAAPIWLGWVFVEMQFFQARRLNRLLAWLKITQSKPFRSDAVRTALTVATLVCSLWLGVLVGFFWRITYGYGSFMLVAGLALCLGFAWWQNFDQHADPSPSELAELQAEDALPELGRPPGHATSLPHAQANAQVAPATTKYDFPWQLPTLNLEKLAGMAELKSELNSAIQGFRTYAKGGRISDRNGILLSGPPGNGKTTFALAIAGELGLPMFKLSCQDLTSKWLNESPGMIKELFRQAGELPCVVFFDEFDGVGMSRGDDNQHSENRKTVTALLAEIDSARSRHIVLIAATNFVEQMDPALIRDGRFDFRIEIPYPDAMARLAIVRGLANKFNVTTPPDVTERVAQLWERRSVAFMEATVKRVRDQSTNDRQIATIDDFKRAARDASRRASAIPKEGKRLSEVALTSEVRREANSLVYRLRNWEELERRGGEPPSGVLLYGPPGTGKTSFVRALARELGDWHVFEVNTAEILQNPRKFKDVMELANHHRPAIIFLDEADELLRDRAYSSSVTATNEILKAMDGMLGKVPEVVFMAATNNTNAIDEAAMRGGRFGEKIYMGPLEWDDLLRFLELEFQARANVRFADDLTPARLTARLQSAAPADVLGLLRKAINYTFDQSDAGRPVCMDDIDRALRTLKVV